jgi:hypothetical protein
MYTIIKEYGEIMHHEKPGKGHSKAIDCPHKVRYIIQSF